MMFKVAVLLFVLLTSKSEGKERDCKCLSAEFNKAYQAVKNFTQALSFFFTHTRSSDEDAENVRKMNDSLNILEKKYHDADVAFHNGDCEKGSSLLQEYNDEGKKCDGLIEKFSDHLQKAIAEDAEVKRTASKLRDSIIDLDNKWRSCNNGESIMDVFGSDSTTFLGRNLALGILYF